jgi:hypothetical protein
MDADKLRAMAKKLHASMGSDNKNEQETARAKLDELLARNKKTWNDLPGLLAGDDDGLTMLGRQTSPLPRRWI